MTGDRARRRRLAWSLLAVALALSGCLAAGPAATPTPPVVAASPTPATSAVDDLGVEHLADPDPVLARPPQPDLAPRFRRALVADPCVDRDLATPAVDDAALSLLDRSYALPATYAPADLVAASAAGFSGASGGKLVSAAIVDDLAAMRAAWSADGLTLIIQSAYRSYGAQAATFDSWASRLGVAEALRRSARPGHSEHQLGTAMDITSPGWGGRFGDWARETAEGAWLVEHAWEYGFVMSYPAGSEGTTCFSYEPWHWRWVGREVAAVHRESGLTLREVLAAMLTDG